MTEDEAYKVHIQYTFNAFCKIVIRHAAIDKILNLRRRWEREVSLDYLMNEKFVQLAEPEQLEEYLFTACGQTAVLYHAELAAALALLPEQTQEELFRYYFLRQPQRVIGVHIGRTRSSIESTVKLPKKAILIIRDRVSRFTTEAVCVKETDGHDLMAEEGETEVENVIWDGEALLDVSVFEENDYADKGMMLLRNRFFKTCAFNTNLQQWFADNCITQVSQLAGYTTARKIEDIKLVITESSLKYLKFMPKGMPIEQGFKRWLDALYEGKNTSTFGIVKTDHDAPLMDGWMAHTNYQLINTIGLTREGVGKLLENSFDFLQGMLCDPAFLRYHIHMPADSAKIDQDEIPDLERYRRETVLDMTCRTPDFEKTDFYKSFRSDTVKNFKNRLKDGRIAVCGNYEVLFGNPYEFLVSLTDETYEPTESLMFENDEVCTVAFPHGETVLCARSPREHAWKHRTA